MRGWCPGCLRVCPGKDADGFCLDADRAELDRRAGPWVAVVVLEADGSERVVVIRRDLRS